MVLLYWPEGINMEINANITWKKKILRVCTFSKIQLNITIYDAIHIFPSQCFVFFVCDYCLSYIDIEDIEFHLKRKKKRTRKPTCFIHSKVTCIWLTQYSVAVDVFWFDECCNIFAAYFRKKKHSTKRVNKKIRKLMDIILQI